MEAAEKLKGIPKTALPLLLGIGAAILVLGFVIGFLPMWAKARGSQGSVERLQRQTAILELQNALAATAIDARRGRYEAARQQTSQFYTRLNYELSKGTGSAFSPAQRQNATALLAQRDELITLLARNDPASADRLIDVYLAFRKAIGEDPVEPAPAVSK
jgi:hypothetical protein